MSNTIPLVFKCHVTPPSPAVITVTVDDVVNEFTVQPTINWVDSSNDTGAETIVVDIDIAQLFATIEYDEQYNRLPKTCNFKIQAQGSDVLICGYDADFLFDIATQPVWNDPSWQPYDITGHGTDKEYAGPGSLQILDGQTVEFVGKFLIHKTKTPQ
jgi:hypothetical protein